MSLVDRYMRALSPVAKSVLRALCEAYPHSLPADVLIGETKLRGGQALGPVLAAINGQADILECVRPVSGGGSDGFVINPAFCAAWAEYRQVTDELDKPQPKK